MEAADKRLSSHIGQPHQYACACTWIQVTEPANTTVVFHLIAPKSGGGDGSGCRHSKKNQTTSKPINEICLQLVPINELMLQT